MRRNPFKFVFWLDRYLEKLESLLLVWVLLTVLVFAFLPVFLRVFFDTSIIWAPELNRLLVLWIGFLGAALAVKENRHISLEVLTKFIPKKWLPLTQFFVYCFIIYVCGSFTYISYHFFQFELANINMGDYLFGTFAKTYFKIIYPVGFGLITYHYIIKLLEVLLVFAGRDVPGEQVEDEEDDDSPEISVSIKFKG